MTSNKVCICSLVVTIIFTLISLLCEANPIYETWDPREITEEDMNKPTRCESDHEIEVLCQRCAKSTKSNTVYPYCCSDQENVLVWCERYLNFGIHK
ncbi:hypothetical protein L9F63_018291 [Diploptera punctata]|uniref:Uncharacterized protein n=1 Tax=Diploptera punctata TaxID=6984 RepID=A0AAD7ZWS3_DIPPU|nr:hypothetical protein L9F63_018291 [Diploptera punctata]